MKRIFGAASTAIAMPTTALAAVALAIPASSQAASKRCPTFRANGVYSVTILKGPVSCATADKVLKSFMTGHGRMHGPKNGPAYLQSWTVDGWTCGHGAGGGACIQHGKTDRTARYWIQAVWVHH